MKSFYDSAGKSTSIGSVVNKSVAVELSGFLKNRGYGLLSADTFKINLLNPVQSDEGWYFCSFNTMKSVEVKGALELKRKIGKLIKTLCHYILYKFFKQGDAFYP